MGENDKIRKIFTDHHCDVFSQKPDEQAVINSFCTSTQTWRCDGFKDKFDHQDHSNAFGLLGYFEKDYLRAKKAFCMGLKEVLDHQEVTKFSSLLESLAELDFKRKDYDLAIQTYRVLLASKDPNYPDLDNSSELAKALFEKATRQPKLGKEEKNALLYEAERLNWKIVEECNKKLKQNGFYEYLKSRANSYVDLMKIEDARSPRNKDKINEYFDQAMRDLNQGTSIIDADNRKADFFYAKTKFLEEAVTVYYDDKLEVKNYQSQIIDLYRTLHQREDYKQNSHFLFSYAQAALVQDKYNEAIDLFNEALEPFHNQSLNPKEVISTHIGLAKAYWANKKYPKACEEGRLAKVEALKFLRINPNDQAVQFLLQRARDFQ